MPWDAQAEREWSAGENKYGDRYADLNGAWKAREEWYGFGETNNPYSQASMLAHQHKVDNRRVLNSAGQQLYSGITVSRHQGADRSYNVNLESLKAAYEAERAKKERELQEAMHEWEAEQAAIREGPIARAEEVEPMPLATPGGGGGGGGGKGKGKGKKGKGKGK